VTPAIGKVAWKRHNSLGGECGEGTRDGAPGILGTKNGRMWPLVNIAGEGLKLFMTGLRGGGSGGKMIARHRRLESKSRKRGRMEKRGVRGGVDLGWNAG